MYKNYSQREKNVCTNKRNYIIIIHISVHTIYVQVFEKKEYALRANEWKIKKFKQQVRQRNLSRFYELQI